MVEGGQPCRVFQCINNTIGKAINFEDNKGTLTSAWAFEDEKYLVALYGIDIMVSEQYGFTFISRKNR